jgi:hypothetical protein
MNMSLIISFDSKVDIQSRLIQKTLVPLAFNHRISIKIRKGLTETHIICLFENLKKAKLHELSDISPLFDTIIHSSRRRTRPLYLIEKWEQQKGRQPFSLHQILSSASNAAAHRNILHQDLIIPDASQSQLKLLRILIRIFIEALLTDHCKIPIVQTKGMDQSCTPG